MGPADDRPDQESLVGLSEAATPATAAAATAATAHPFATADDARYRELRVVGAGGLGTVLLAHDERLARDVALKRIGPGVDERAAAARFAREARLTARLDHPGIVPIHDAGLTADGRLYYTMRLIRGRSLAELAAAATDLPARLALTTALTAACHAVGFAHRQGVIHRDLKPANIMVGEYGETQVVDWGLADELDALPALGAGAGRGGVVGTPAYLSPEAARGDGHTVAADVWSLGVMLHELVSGARRFDGERDAVLAALRAAALPPARWPEACPAELRAIGDKAMAPTPGARYVDAQAMAADLEAFRDGRRVAAHAYTTLELARRLVVAWRWPLAVAGALVLATIGSLALTAHRTERQRQRAVAAERATQRELVRAEESLGWALAASAVAAHGAGQGAQAELLAAHALTHGELPDARGVLAAAGAGAHPTRSDRITLPGCATIVPASYQLALCVAPAAVELWELTPPRRRWRRDLALAGAVDLDETWVVGWTVAGEILVLDGATGAERDRHAGLAGVAQAERNWGRTRVALHDRRTLVIVEPDAGAPRRLGRVCGDRPIDAVAAGEHHAWVVCGGGELRQIDDDGRITPYRDTGFGTARRPASALGLSEPETDLAIGGLGGDVLMLDLRGCFADDCAGRPDSELFTAVTTHAIQRVANHGHEAVVVADSGDAVVVRRGLGAELMRIPLDDGRAATFLEGDLATGGDQWRLWSFPQGVAPRRFAGQAGMTTGALSPDGALLAAAGSAGVVEVWSTTSGQRLATLPPGDGAVTALDFAPDGARLVVARGGAVDGVRGYATADWTAVTVDAPPAGATVAGFTVDGALLALHDGARTARWDWPTTAAPRRATVRDTRAGAEVTIDVGDAEIIDLALGGDGRWLAAATTAGRIDVWAVATGRLVARLRGHRQRATWVAFHGAALWSAGWDGEVLRWDLAALDAAPADAVRATERAWGLTLDDVLATSRGSAPPSP